MQKLKIVLVAAGFMIAATSCGSHESSTTTTTTDSVGGTPAPSSDATDMSKTSMDSLNTNTTDVKADTPLKTDKPATATVK